MYAAGAPGIWSKSVDGGQKRRGTRPWAHSAAFLDSLFKEGATHVDAKEPVNKLDAAEHRVCKQSCDMFWLLVSNPASDLCKQSRRVTGQGEGDGGEELGGRPERKAERPGPETRGRQRERERGAREERQEERIC